MGKSDKKIKADRINALRKQYDDFLDEDKKRKERNEFILGRLDKMRACAPVMQIRQTPNAYVDARCALYNRCIHTIEKPSSSGNGVQGYLSELLFMGNLANKSDETLLHEITKKYILIPKSSTFINIDPREYEAKPIVKDYTDNDDWKSKYEILARLKQNEKEPIEIPTQDKYVDNDKEEPTTDIIDEPRFEREKPYENILPESENEIEMPEKKLNENRIVYNIKNPEGMTISRNEKREILIPPPEDSNIVGFTLPEENFYSYSYSDDTKPQTNSPNESTVDTADNKLDLQPEYDHSLPNEELANRQQIYDKNTNFEIEYEKQYQPAEEQYFENMVDPQENEMTPIEVMNTGDLVGHINKEEQHGAHAQVSEDHQYPIEVINPNDLTPNDNVKVWDGVNVNPEGYGINESHFDPAYQQDPHSTAYAEQHEDPENYSAPALGNDVTSGIEEFNAEQSELFYQEQGDQSAYNQQGLVDAEFVQNENYNLQYSGYEGTQEGTPAEVNEQEETSQRYDPYYEEQYTPYTQEYEYPNPAHDEQQPSVVAHNDEEQEFNTDKCNNETSENIQQQLDNEQGFVEQNDRMEVEKPAGQETQPVTQASE